jgi:hypothetical protein
MLCWSVISFALVSFQRAMPHRAPVQQLFNAALNAYITHRLPSQFWLATHFARPSASALNVTRMAGWFF